jgi:hypothetical protein
MFFFSYSIRHADGLVVVFPFGYNIIHADGPTKLSEIIVLDPVRSGAEKNFNQLTKNFCRSPFL